MKNLFPLLFLFVCACQHGSRPAPVGPLPSEAQLAWHEMEMNAFIHFTTNTFTGLEWGTGAESPAIFNPQQFDANQWITVLKETGFKGVILTCKHHDGFCLWPSQYTDHSVKNAPFMDGKGDIVKAVSEACKEHGLKFGVYLSPWDRNHAKYGKPEYLSYYRDQLKEIFDNYGPVFEMWFDGANGGTGYYGGANERRQIDGSTYYDWPTTLEMVKDIEPDVIFFSDAGPGVRWVGNERGIAGETNWNTITPDTLYAGKAGIEKLLQSGHEDGTHWIPAEVDVSIRPGWFYHAEEDSLVKSPERLFNIYLTSVGRGSTLLLNVPPDRRGLLHEADVAALRGFRNILDSVFRDDLARNARVTESASRGSDFAGSRVVDGNANTFWAMNDGETAGYIDIELEADAVARHVVIQEYIRLGQRVKNFSIRVENDGKWKTVATGTTIGYKRIIPLGGVTARRVRVSILSSKAVPLISSVQVY